MDRRHRRLSSSRQAGQDQGQHSPLVERDRQIHDRADRPAQPSGSAIRATADRCGAARIGRPDGPAVRWMDHLVPSKQRQFAVEVVEELRAHGFTAYWAGGCVRDQLLHRTPWDYDVATDAKPDEIRHVFGRRRTLAIGAAFGVITVLGPKEAGQVEVTTFRRDAAYHDGRHPDSVTFSSPEEDARRRDFTINGMFYD